LLGRLAADIVRRIEGRPQLWPEVVAQVDLERSHRRLRDDSSAGEVRVVGAEQPESGVHVEQPSLPDRLRDAELRLERPTVGPYVEQLVREILAGWCDHCQACAENGPPRRLRELGHRGGRGAPYQHRKTDAHVADASARHSCLPASPALDPRVRHCTERLRRPAQQAKRVPDADRWCLNRCVDVEVRQRRVVHDSAMRHGEAGDEKRAVDRNVRIGPGIEILRESGRRAEQEPDDASCEAHYVRDQGIFTRRKPT
jgi:hypothetical protein